MGGGEREGEGREEEGRGEGGEGEGVINAACGENVDQRDFPEKDTRAGSQ